MLVEISIKCRNGNYIHGFKKVSGEKADHPLVYVPGLSGVADDGVALIESLEGSEHITLSMRGRGKSDAPDTGYRVDDHAADLADVLNSMDLENYVLHGYSVAVLYILLAANTVKTAPSALILGDYPPYEKRFVDGWSESFSKISLFGKSVLENISLKVLSEIQAASQDRDSDEFLKGVSCPVLVLSGANSNTPPAAMLTQNDFNIYRSYIPEVFVYKIDGAGHFFRETHRNEYTKAISDFLLSLSNRKLWQSQTGDKKENNCCGSNECR